MTNKHSVWSAASVGLVLCALAVVPVGASAAPAHPGHAATSAGQVEPAKPVRSARPVVTKVQPAAGPLAGGTTVTIKGRRLRGTTEVRFGNRLGTGLAVVNGHQLTVVAPPHAAGKVYVRVLTAAGRSRRPARARFTYQAPATKAPTVTAVTPEEGPRTGGTKVTITGTGFIAGATATFDGVPGTALTVVSDSQLTVTSPAGAAGPADVAVTNPGGTAVARDAFFYSTPAAAVQYPTGLTVYFAEGGTSTPVPGATPAAGLQTYDLDAAGRVTYDLGANGLSSFDPATAQTRQVSTADTTALAVAAHGLVYYARPNGTADVTGTYVYDPRTGTSTRFTSEIATGIVAVANGRAFLASSSGLRHYDPATAALTLVTASTVGLFDAAGDGQTVFATVGGVLTRFDRSASGFDGTELPFDGAPGAVNVVSFDVSESGSAYIDLSVNGTWRYDPGTGQATRIDTRNPVFVVADRAGNGYFDYAGNGGTVRYAQASGALETLSADPNAFFGPDDVDTAGALYLDYNADGLYRFDPATSLLNQPRAGTQISATNPDSTVGNR